MKTYVNLQNSVAEFLLEWEMFQTKIVEKIKKHFMFDTVFPEIVPFMK
jgi:hypothetical protein